MSFTDTLGDLFTRIRNSQNARFLALPYRASKLTINVLDVLHKEGFIRGYEYVKDPSDFKKVMFSTSTNNVSSRNDKEVIIFLKYLHDKPVIKEIKRISKPGRRVYTGISRLPKAYNGLGVYILSTSKGILSDREARLANVGGEVLCKVL